MGTSQNYTEILLRLGIDPKSINDLRTGTRKVDDILKDIEKSGKKISDQDLEFIRKKMDEIVAETKAAEKAAKDYQDQIKAARGEAQKLNETAEKLSSLGTKAAASGAAILTPLILAQKSYISAAKNSETASSDWLKTSTSLEDSQQRIGRIVTQTLLPGYRSLADVVEAISILAEKNPWLVKGTLATGGVLAAGGALAAVAGQGLKIAADAKFLAAATMQNTAADKMLAAAAAQAGKSIPVSAAAGLGGKLFQMPLTEGARQKNILDARLEAAAAGKSAADTVSAGKNKIGVGDATILASSLIIGGQVGLSLGNLINKMLGQKEQSWGDIAVTGLRLARMPGNIAMAGIANLLPEFEGFRRSVIDIQNTMDGFIDGSGNLKKQESEYLTSLEKEKQLKLAIANIEQRNAAEKAVAEEAQLKTRYENDKLQIEADGAKELNTMLQRQADERSAIESKSAQERESTLHNLAEANKQAESKYMTQRSDIVRDGGIEIERIEEDAQRRILQLRKTHNKRSAELVAARDALGFVEEQRSYQEQQNTEVENANLEIKRRREDIALRLSDLDRSYREESRLRNEAAAYKLRQIYNAEQEELRILADKQKRELEMFTTHQQNLLNALLSAFQKQLVAIKAEGGSYTNGGGTPLTGSQVHAQASGGYASYGKYLLGDAPGGGPGRKEFVMSGPTTAAAEQIMQGQLSQASILNAIYQGSQSRQMVFHDNRRFSGEVSVAQRRAIQRDTEDAIVRGFENG